MVLRLALCLALSLLMALGCSTGVSVERHAFRLAEQNRARINQVRLGQTLVEVQKIMGPPERRAARLRYDGVSVEEWSYITDYVRKMDALILFVGGKVQEIQSTSWDKRIRDSLAAEQREFVSDRISVVTRGAGPDVILVSGLTGHRDQWAGVAETLDDRYRLHLVQVNGFAGVAAGGNAEGPVSAPVAEEIARYIGEARLERPAIIGHSMGGSIAMMLAARHPERVGRVMVVDMMPFMGAVFGPAGSTPEGLRAVADQTHAGILAAPPGEGMIGQMFPTMTLKEDMRPQLLQGARTSDRRTVANAFHELIVTDLRPELPRIAVPVTVLYVVPPNVPIAPEQFDATMRGLYADLPNVRLVRIDDSRHFIHWDQPERFVTEVDAFMAR